MIDDEIERILRGMQDQSSRFTLRLGETVRIKSGPFQSFTGKIEGINQAKGLLKIKVNVFGRAQPVELRNLDVEKISP